MQKQIGIENNLTEVLNYINNNIMKNGILTKKDFLSYLAKGGNVNFSSPIKLNRTQLSKLTSNQIEGRDPIYIEGVKGFLDGKGFWNPSTKK